MGFHDLKGLQYEAAYMAEVENFQDAHRGVPGNDVAAALILRDHGRTELLQRLYRREITVISNVDEDTSVDDLVFQDIRPNLSERRKRG